MHAGLRFLAALLVVSCGASSAQTINYSNVCLLTQAGKMVAKVGSCSDYYLCQAGGPVLQTCPDGQSFSKDLQSCVPSSQSSCNPTPCAGQQYGTWSSNPADCTSYYYCSASGPLKGYCPANEYFDPVSQSCGYNSTCVVLNNGNGDSLNSGEQSSINICVFMPNNVFFGSASSCDGWNYCQNNELTSSTCPSGMKFNVALGECAYTATCQQVTHDPLLSNPSTGATCSTAGAVTPANACNGFYTCTNNVTQFSYCASGQNFDTSLGKCSSNAIFTNTVCNRCLGVNSGFVSAADDYTTYVYCQNGVMVGQPGHCTGTNYYFDAESMACIQCSSSLESTGCPSASSEES